MARPARFAQASIAVLLATGSLQPQSPGTTPEPLTLERQKLCVVAETVQWNGPRVGGPAGMQVELPAALRLSPDGKRIAWSAFRNERPITGVDTEEHGPFDFGSAPRWADDGSIVAYRVGKRVDDRHESWTVLVHNGERWAQRGTYDWISEVAVSPAGTLAFWEQPGARVQASGIYSDQPMVLHLGEHQSKKLNQPSSSMPPIFGPKGKRCLASALLNGSITPFWFDGRRPKPVKNGVSDPASASLLFEMAFGPRASRLALVFAVVDPTAPPTAPFRRRLTIDGKTPDALRDRSAHSPIFGSKGRSLACTIDAVGPEPGQRIARLDLRSGRLLEGHEWLEVRDATWSKNGNRLAYVARDAEGWHLVVEDRVSEPFELLGAPRFVGELVQVGGRSGRELFRLKASL